MKICNDTESFRNMLIKELFGVSNLEEAEFRRLSLTVHKGNKLSRSKIKSLGKQYFAIPVQFRSYFPDVSELIVDDDDDEVEIEPEVFKPKKKKEKTKDCPWFSSSKKEKRTLSSKKTSSPYSSQSVFVQIFCEAGKGG